MKGVQVIKVTEGHEDERRIIEEVFNGKFQARQLKILKVKKTSILGNHYHKFKSFFYIMQGGGHYKFEDIKTKENAEIIVSERDLIIIDSLIAHAAELIEGTITLEGNSREYLGHQDDIKYELIKNGN